MQALEDIKKKRKSRQENEKERMWEERSDWRLFIHRMYKMVEGGMLEEDCLLLCPVDGRVKEVCIRYGGAILPHLAPINYIL